METAINIAFACSLIERSMIQLTVKADFPEVDALEDEGLYEEAARLGNTKIREQLENIERDMAAMGGARNQDQTYAMIIEGKVQSVIIWGCTQMHVCVEMIN